MEVLEPKENLSRVKSCHLFGEHFLLAQVVEEHSSRNELHDKVQLERGLEGAPEVCEQAGVNT